MNSNDYQLLPVQASSVAGEVDALYFFLIAVSGFVSVLIIALIFYFGIKYRRRPGNEIAQDEEAPAALEIAWIVIPTVVFLAIFLWGAKLYFRLARVPENALDVYATGKQWMWKFQHTGGQSEINALHVPVNRPVRLTMASEDVIHSFFVPAFRVKGDVLPNRYTHVWFQATKTGRYRLFCTEYCGTLHSGMIGYVEVMEPGAYEQWLGGGASLSLSAEGAQLFQKYACNTCHTSDSTARGPVLGGLFGHTVDLRDGQRIKADENYIRDSILYPESKVVAGFEPIMPTFKGQLSESDLLKLVAYIKSLPSTIPKAPVAAVESPQSSADSSGAPVDPEQKAK